VSGVVLAGCGGSNSASGQARAQDAQAKEAALNAETRLEACFVDAQTYRGCETPAQLAAAGGSAPPLGSGPGQLQIKTAAQSYSITAHSRSGNLFVLAKDPSARIRRTCQAKKTAGGCLGGAW